MAPELGNHVVCYCDDCQAFACFLGRPGVVDAGGGTAIFQMPRSHLTLTEGLGELRCVRLSTKGMHRWYAGCCRTPIGNTLGARVPFVGLIDTCIDLDEPARREILGEPIGIQARFAHGQARARAHPRAPLVFIGRALAKVVSWWLSGKGAPSPFFDASGAPAARPQVLSAAERDALRTS